MFKVAREIFLYFAIAILAFVLFANFVNRKDPVEPLKFDQLMKRVEAGKIIDAVVNNNDGIIQGKQQPHNGFKRYRTEGPANHPELYYQRMTAKGVKVSFSNAGNG